MLIQFRSPVIIRSIEEGIWIRKLFLQALQDFMEARYFVREVIVFTACLASALEDSVG
jgi:hypothetical protein